MADVTGLFPDPPLLKTQRAFVSSTSSAPQKVKDGHVPVELSRERSGRVFNSQIYALRLPSVSSPQPAIVVLGIKGCFVLFSSFMSLRSHCPLLKSLSQALFNWL